MAAGGDGSRESGMQARHWFIYAGFDVFDRIRQRVQSLPQRYCAAHELEEAVVLTRCLGQTHGKPAANLYRGAIAMIQRCSMLTNLMCFARRRPDSGTVLEVNLWLWR